MSAGSRIRRGFHRIGLVVAAPSVALAMIFLVFAGISWRNLPAATTFVPYPQQCRPGLFDDLAPHKPNPAYERCLEQYEKDAAANLSWTANEAMRQKPFENIMFSLSAAIFGALWYLACWAIGWVLAGFTRDQEAA